MKMKLWNDREITLDEEVVKIAKEIEYELNPKSLELDLQIMGYSKESNISNEKLGHLCSRMLAEEMLAMSELAKALASGTLKEVLKKGEEA